MVRRLDNDTNLCDTVIENATVGSHTAPGVAIGMRDNVLQTRSLRSNDVLTPALSLHFVPTFLTYWVWLLHLHARINLVDIALPCSGGVSYLSVKRGGGH